MINSDLTANQNDRYMKLRYSVQYQVEEFPCYKWRFISYSWVHNQTNAGKLLSDVSFFLSLEFISNIFIYLLSVRDLQLRKNDQNIGLSIFNHGIAHTNQLWFSQQWYGVNHGANRFADSRRNLGPEWIDMLSSSTWISHPLCITFRCDIKWKCQVAIPLEVDTPYVQG